MSEGERAAAEAPLYQTETVYTEAEYLRFAKTVQLRVGKLRLKAAAVILCFFVLALFSLADANRQFALFYGIAAVLFPLLLWGISHRRLKQAYASNKSLQGMRYEIRFYKDHMETAGSIGHSSVYYDKLFRVLETERNFYLMVSRNQGVVLIKANCTPELIQFVRGLAA